MTAEGWRPLRPPSPDQRGSGAFVVSPFMRLARVHAFGAASDAAIAVTLAGSVFFSISPDDSRGRVALYLLLTMAPFAVVAPLIGPVIDRVRGGRRMMIIATAFGRGVIAFLMIGDVGTLWLFPEAFALLVLQKSYSIAKSAVVPELVRADQDLVSANSRLALISAVSGIAGVAIAGVFSLIGGPSYSAAIAMCGFIITTVMAFQTAPIVVAAEPTARLEREELRDATVLLAASATAILRGLVGFVTFLLAFEFRGGKDGLDVSTLGSAAGGATASARDIDIAGDPAAPVWHFGVVLVAAGIGALVGAKIAPSVRQRIPEERMLVTALGVVFFAALFATFSGNLSGATVLSFAIASCAATGKLAFDSLVQRAAPDANYGRSFARFEARFQFAWVVGAFIPAVIPLNIVVGGIGVAVASGFAIVSYVLGRPGRSMLSWRPNQMKSAEPSDEEVALVPLEEPSAEFEEFTDDDLRPSQPQAPAGTSEWAGSWDAAAPIVSSVEGVHVEPPTGNAAKSGDETGPPTI